MVQQVVGRSVQLPVSRRVMISNRSVAQRGGPNIQVAGYHAGTQLHGTRGVSSTASYGHSRQLVVHGSGAQAMQVGYRGVQGGGVIGTSRQQYAKAPHQGWVS